MDLGNYNCRDYYITPHIAPTTPTHDSRLLPRHESFDELEQRSRSPASQCPKFPLLRLPLELRQQILQYLLPYSREFRDSSLLRDHARNFSAVRTRDANGMSVPQRLAASPSAATSSNVVWQRGNVNLLRVNKQIHAEAAELVYGRNTFLLFVTYLNVNFRFRWLLPSGLAPSRTVVDFLKFMPLRYLQLVRKVVLHVDHVDPYTGMIKFNVQGKGLAAGLKKQLDRLVDALQCLPEQDCLVGGFAQERRLAKFHVRVSNGNSVVETLKPSDIRLNDEIVQIDSALDEILEPLGRLRGVREVSISGAVPIKLAARLTAEMKARATSEDLEALRAKRQLREKTTVDQLPLCVYGNDML